MRFTISLEEDLYRVAKSMAKTEDTSISKAVNRLIRKGLDSTQHPPTKKGKKGVVSTFPVSGVCRPLTEKDVYNLEIAEDTAKWNGS